MGQLASRLNTAIDATVSADLTRDQVLQAMADAAAITVEDVNAILDGTTLCPMPEVLDAFASVLVGVTADELKTAGNEDGCEYEVAAAEEPVADPAPEPAPEPSAIHRGQAILNQLATTKRSLAAAVKEAGKLRAENAKLKREQAKVRAENAKLKAETRDFNHAVTDALAAQGVRAGALPARANADQAQSAEAVMRRISMEKDPVKKRALYEQNRELLGFKKA